MNSINYLKLDIRLVKETIKFFLLVPLILILMITKESPMMALGYMFFFLIIAASVPFSVESNEKCDKMYYMLPSRIHSMVLGRFLYLISAMLIVWLVDAGAMIYLYQAGIVGASEVGIVCLSGVIATIICFCQYPIYYKFGMEKGRMLSMLLYMAPAFVIFALPSLLKNGGIISPELLDRALAFTVSNKMVLPLLGVVIIGMAGGISYMISCSICRKKEI